MKTIGQSLQKALRKRKMTQRQLAELIDKPPTQLNKWMLDKNEISVHTLIDIADALKMTLDELVEREIKFDVTDHYIINDSPSEIYTKLASKEISSIKQEIAALQNQLTQINTTLTKLNTSKDYKKS